MSGEKLSKFRNGTAMLYVIYLAAVVLMFGYILLSNVSKYSKDAGTGVFWFSIGVAIPSAALNYMFRIRMKEILKEDEASNWELGLFHSKEYKNLTSLKNTTEITLLLASMLAATLLLS